MDDDGDMAEMYLTEKKQKSEAYALSERERRTDTSGGATEISKSAPVSPVASISGAQNPQRAFNRIFSMSKYGSLTGSSDNGENIEQLEMLLEAYFVVADNSLSNLLSVWDVWLPMQHLFDLFILCFKKNMDFFFFIGDAAQRIHWWYWRFYQY